MSNAEVASDPPAPRYVPDVYYKEQEDTNRYLADHQIVAGTHAGAQDTSQLMYLDASRKWIRADKLAPSGPAQQPTTGVDGDPTKATPELGKMILDSKVNDAVAQIRAFRTARR